VPRVLYFDCFSGISGDMVLGAFLDAGLPLEDLRAALGSLALDTCSVRADRVLRAGVSATQFTVHEHRGDSRDDDDAYQHDADVHHGDAGVHRQSGGTHHHGKASHSHGARVHGHHHRSLREIRELVDRSALSAGGRDRAKALFARLAGAEARIHDVPMDSVHLHEVGALDSIIDIVGAVFALEWAAVDRVVCSPLNVGGGTVHSAHGLFPVPAPATLALLGTAPVYSGPVQKEMVTPTGALIATDYASAFGPVPAMSIDLIGYGAGSRDNPGTPNVLRILIGRETRPETGDRVVVLECEIDDMNPQLFGAAMERLYDAGALEVFYVPVQMKKNRPGTLLTVVAAPHLRPVLADVVFRETTTIGLRYYEVDRDTLHREVVPVETPLGTIRFKLASRGGRVVNAVAEYEDCVALARAHNLAVKEVQAAAYQAYGARTASPPPAL
jgi:uncharacterized protein (TIGR00299 family) protein